MKSERGFGKVNEFSKRLNLALKERNMSASELSKRTGIGRSSISEWLNGKYEAKQDKVYLMANVLDVDEGWLIGLDVPMEKHKQITTYNPSNLNPVPIVGKVAAGEPNYAVEDVIGYMTAPPDKQSTDGLIYLEVKSDSMDKQFPIGSYALVDTNVSIENGDVAVVKINGDEATLKQVKFNEERGQIFLIPNSFNDNYNPVVINSNEDEAVLVGKVVGMYQSL